MLERNLISLMSMVSDYGLFSKCLSALIKRTLNAVALSAFTKGRTSIFHPNALFDFAQSGIPRVVEISVDSRREIDKELKRICEDFIMESGQAATEPLANFITQVSAFQVANNLRTERIKLSDQSFATPSKFVQCILMLGPA
jgi:hypothetical protein